MKARRDNRVVRAPEDDPVGPFSAGAPHRGLARVRDDPLGRHLVAALDRIDEARAGVLDETHARATLVDLFPVDAALHRARRPEDDDQVVVVLLRVLRRRHRPGRPRRGFDRGSHDTEHVAAGPSRFMRKPRLLQSPRRHRGRRVAPEKDQPAAGREEPLHPVSCQRDDLLGRPVAIGNVGMVAEIDE